MAYNLAIMDSVYKHKLSLFLAINDADSSTVDSTLSAFDSQFTSPLDSTVYGESADSTLESDSIQVAQDIIRFEKIPDSLIGVFHLDSVRMLCNDFSNDSFLSKKRWKTVVKHTDYYDLTYLDTLENLSIEENRFRSNKLVIEPKGLVRWLIKAKQYSMRFIKENL